MKCKSLILVILNLCIAGCSPALNARDIFKDRNVRNLAVAAEKGDTNRIDQILAEGVDINSVGDEAITPLVWALVKRNTVGHEHLLKRGADPYARPDVIAEPDPKIKFAECVLKYNTMNGETEITLYNIKVSRAIEMSEKTVKDIFDLSEFKVETLIFGYTTGKPRALKVLAQTKNFMNNTPVQQLFTNLLGAKAKVDLKMAPSGMTMNVIIPMQKDMYVADNNALQVRQDENKKLILMEFDLSDIPNKPLEVAIGWKGNVPVYRQNPFLNSELLRDVVERENASKLISGK